MREISGGALTVPVISIGRQVMIGFDPDKLEKELKNLN